MKNPFKNKKGSFMGIIPMVVGLIIIMAILVLQTPILGGIITATPTQTGAMSYAQGNITAGIASGATMEGIIPTVAAGVILLSLLMVLSHKA